MGESGTGLTYGMVGGGIGAFIGDVHRRAIALEGVATIAAGVFSRDLSNNRRTGAALGLNEKRVYPSYQKMAEAESKREDKIDFVVVVTPNNTHFDICRTFLEKGVNVACDKPLAVTMEEASTLQNIVERTGTRMLVTYTNAGYQMVKQAKEMVDRGELGELYMVMAEYPQGWQAALPSEPAKGKLEVRRRWRMDPEIAGAAGSIADIGTHIENTVSYITGSEIESVSAVLSRFGHGRKLDNNASVNVRFKNGAVGHFWTSQVAMGYRNALRIRLIGSEGSIEWAQETPDLLSVASPGSGPHTLSKGALALHELPRLYRRIPPGHPEGTYEAFANLYRAFQTDLLLRREVDLRRFLPYVSLPDESFTRISADYPGVTAGVRGMQFIHACLSSDRRDAAWVKPDQQA